MATRKKPLSEQVVVVTGASSGLGRAVARGAAARSAKLVVTARGEDGLDACVREAQAFGSAAIGVPADCAVEDEAGRVVEQAVDRFGRIDTYVANGIVTVYAETYRYEPRELRRIDRDRQKLGMQPQPVPPIYQPEPFAEAVLECCERPVRELPVGWGAQKLL